MNKTQLINEIQSKIYPNNNGEITAQKLQDVLLYLVEFAADIAEHAGTPGTSGVGISNISMVSGEGMTNRSLKITLTNNETYAYPIFDGKDGATGAQGPKGVDGKNGRDGVNGTDGRNGVDGRDGIDGKDGKDGKDGYEGRDGRDGKDGKDGKDGRDGRDGEDGKDGQDGKDGLNGKDGKQGRAGAAIRGPYDYYAISAQTRWWCSGEEMEESPENTKWIDIVCKDQKYYACKIGYYGRLSPWEDVVEDHWQEGESFEFVATKLLLAKNASIDFLTGNEIYLRDRFGNITAGAAGGDRINFWAGAEDPSDGYFQVHADGKLVARYAEIEGVVTAHSLTLGEQSLEDYLGDKFEANESVVSAIAKTVFDAETSDIVSITHNDDGSVTHVMNIGGREYRWDTYDAGDYMILGDWTGDSAHTGTGFIVSKQGLLQANNAIIYGKIYASEGYFKGSVSATDGYFRGDITANSLTLGTDALNTVKGVVKDNSVDSATVKNYLTNYIETQITSVNSALTGYVDRDSFDDWVAMWNATHSGQTLTDEEIEALAHQIVGAEISNVIGLTQNPDGSITHTMNIGGREYSWVTYDIGDYVLLGAVFSGETESGYSRFIVSKQGLLQANNAIIYGKIYASEGYFHGSVSATDGYFRGSVSANNGYFKGDITANSLTLGTDALNTVKGVVTENSVDSATVKNYITNFVETQISQTNSALTGYITQDSFDAWVAAWNAAHSGQTLTDEEIEALAERVVGAEISSVIGITENADGSITHTMNIGGREYTWTTYDVGDYLLFGDWAGDSAHTGTGFMVSKQGLLQANNALIYGKIYASEGYFKGSVSATDGYFKGSISADNGYFKGRVEASEGFFNNMSATNITMDNSFFSGNVYANSLTLGNNQTIQDYVAGQISGFAANSGMNYNQVQSAISEFLSNGDYLQGSALTGYVTSGLLEDWIAQWNASHSGQTLTDAEISALTKMIAGAEISNVIGLTRNPDGSITHTMNIGGQEYNWVTYDAGDYLLLGAVFSGMSGSELTKFVVSKEGLLQANNAVIYGKIYASEGYFQGSVSATDGYFKGSVSADSGYFHGDIVANSLKLGNNQTIQEYVGGQIASAVTSGLDTTAVNQLISDFFAASGVTLDGYMTESAFTEWVNNWNATHPDNQLDEAAVSAIVRSELSKVFSETTSDGVTTHTAVIGDRTYTWKTVDTGDYLLIDTGVGTTNSGGSGGFIVSRQGLLEAYNAVVYGKIYASEGYFKGSVSANNGYFRGSVSADNGYFHGDIVANSLTLGPGGQTIQDYVSGKVSAATGSEGLTTQDVNELISGAARDYNWVVASDLGDYLVLGTPYGTASSVTISKQGLLTANNAIISGSIYATNGVFNGDVYADNGRFRGSVSATNGYFKGNVSADSGYFKGSISATNGQFNGKIVASEGEIGSVKITSSGLSGTNIIITDKYMFGDNVEFKGSISATNGVFRGDVYANNGTFNGAITATSLTLEEGASIDVTPEAIGIDTSQFIKLDSGITGNQGEVTISRSGLLQAKNAVISGSIYSTNGYFGGKIEANEGLIGGIKIDTNGLSGNNIHITNNYMYGDNVAFKGSISADNGYFTGDITANSLTIATNASVSGKVYATSGKFENVSGKNITASNFSATNGYFSGKIVANEGSFKGNVSATSLYLGGTSYSSMPSSLSSGDVKNLINDAATTSGWIKQSDGYYQINHSVGENFKVDTNGLLVANNAILSGSVYATNGVFSGTVYATNGKFSGDITANSLTLGTNAKVSGSVYATSGKFENVSGKNITATTFSASNAYLSGKIEANSGYFKGDITANSLTLGNSAKVSGSVYATSGKFENVSGKNITAKNFSADNSYFKGVIKATTLYLGDDEVTSIPDTTGMLKQGVYYSAGTGTSKKVFFVDTNGLLKAQNAIISGTVYATNGVFNGKVYAVDGDFDGNITADTLTLRSTASVSGAVYATSGKFENVSGKNITATNFSASNAYISGKISATALELNTSASNSIKNAIDLDDYYCVGQTVGDSNSSVTISTGGLLTAKNAIISGSVYATNGYFKGKVEATDGSFKGAISATSLYLGGQSYSEMPGQIDVSQYYKLGDSVSANSYGAKFSVSTAGVLTCRNAVVSGNVYATNGYFKGRLEADEGYFAGTLSAANIYLGSKAIKFGESSSALVISDSEITVDYVPATYTKVAQDITGTYSSNSWNSTGNVFSSGLDFKTTASTEINIPSITMTGELKNSYGNGGSYGNDFRFFITAYTIVSTSYYPSTGMNKTAYNSACTSVTARINAGSYGEIHGDYNITIPEFTFTGSTNTTYYLYQQLHIEGTDSNVTTANLISRVPSRSVLVPSKTPPSLRQVKIGSNGIQVFLGSNSFYFTAADRGGDDGPIIALGGNVGGNMKTIKLDKYGLVIDK